MKTYKNCPYEGCEWQLLIDTWTVSPFAHVSMSPADQDRLIREHLDAEHPGWTLDEVQEQVNRLLAAADARE